MRVGQRIKPARERLLGVGIVLFVAPPIVFLDTGFKEGVLLGVVQGVFEWLPISSEGVVALLSQFFFGGLNPIDLALFLHLGTLLAVLVYFRRDWIEVLTLKNIFLLRFFVISTVFSLVVGFPVYKMIKNLVVGNLLLLSMGFGLLSTSFLQRFSKRKGFSLDVLAVITGVLQGFSVIPGLSRSGATIFGLSLGGFSPGMVLKLSYMMSVPVVLFSSAYIWCENPFLFSKSLPALLSSFLVGLVALRFLINLAQKMSFATFTLVFGLLCLLGAITGFFLGI